MRIGLFVMIAVVFGPERNNRSVVALPGSQSRLNEKICGCRIGTPVVMRDTSILAACNCAAKASRNRIGSECLRASVISQRISGCVWSPPATCNTARSALLDAAPEGSARRLPVILGDVHCHQ